MTRIMVCGDADVMARNMHEITKAADNLVVLMGGMVGVASKIRLRDIEIIDLPQIEIEQAPSPKFGSNRAYLKKKKGRS